MVLWMHSVERAVAIEAATRRCLNEVVIVAIAIGWRLCRLSMFGLGLIIIIKPHQFSSTEPIILFYFNLFYLLYFILSFIKYNS